MFILKERESDVLYGSIAKWFINTLITPEYLKLKWLVTDEQQKFLIFFKRTLKKPYAVWEVIPEKINDDLYNNYYASTGDAKKIIKAKEIFFDLIGTFKIALRAPEPNVNSYASMTTRGLLTLYDKELPALMTSQKKLDSLINSEEYKKFPNKIFTEEYKKQIYVTLSHELGHYINTAQTMNAYNTKRVSNRWKDDYITKLRDASKNPDNPEKKRKLDVLYATQTEEIQARITAVSTFILQALNKQNIETLSPYEKEVLTALAQKNPSAFINSLINAPEDLSFDLDWPYMSGWKKDPRLVKAVNLTRSRLYGLYLELQKTPWGSLRKLRSQLGVNTNLTDKQKSLEAQRLLAARRAKILKRRRLGI